MSLISNAMKTAQRERNARGQAPDDPQTVVEGFFPYVAPAGPERSRRAPILIVSGAAVVLLAVVAWLILAPAQPKPVAPKRIPPPLSQAPMAQAPAPLDSTVASRSRAAATGTVSSSPAANVGAASVSPPAASQRQLSSSPIGSTTAAGTSGSAVRATQPSTALPVQSVERKQIAADSSVRSVVREPAAMNAPAARAQPTADYEARASALFNAGDLAGAREQFQLATRFAPTARAWTNYGVTLQRLGDLSGASSAYQAAIGIDGNYLEAWLYQARLAILAGDVAKAIPLLQRARSINPRHSEVNTELAHLEAEAKNWTEARRFAEEAVRSDASNWRAHWYLAVSADQLRDVQLAAREYAAYLQTVGNAEREQARFMGYARQRLTELQGKP